MLHSPVATRMLTVSWISANLTEQIVQRISYGLGMHRLVAQQEEIKKP